MVESLVVERGVLSAAGPVWVAAVRRAEVIGRLAEKDTVGLAGHCQVNLDHDLLC